MKSRDYIYQEDYLELPVKRTDMLYELNLQERIDMFRKSKAHRLFNRSAVEIKFFKIIKM